jgi:hypothetical protein
MAIGPGITIAKKANSTFHFAISNDEDKDDSDATKSYYYTGE